MKRLALIILCIFFILSVLTSCGRLLAIQNDRIVGVILTHSTLSSGQGNIYANAPDEWDESFSFMDAFEGVDVLAYLIVVSPPNTNMSIIYASETVSNNDVNFEFVHQRGNGDFRINAEGTVHATPSVRTSMFAWSTVHQDNEGRIFLSRTGRGMGVGGTPQEGEYWTMPVGDDMAFINLVVEFIRHRHSYNIMQKDEAHTLLTTSTFAPGDAPEIYTTQPSTAYIIMEIICSNGTLLSREILSRASEQYILTHNATQNGLALQTTTEIRWQ